MKKTIIYSLFVTFAAYFTVLSVDMAIAADKQNTQSDLVAVWQYAQDNGSFRFNTDGGKKLAGWTIRNNISPVFIAYKSGNGAANRIPIYIKWAKTHTKYRKYILSKSSKSAQGWTAEPEPIFYLSSERTDHPIYRYTANGGSLGYREHFSTSTEAGSGWKKSADVFGYAADLKMPQADKTQKKKAQPAPVAVWQYFFNKHDNGFSYRLDIDGGKELAGWTRQSSSGPLFFAYKSLEDGNNLIPIYQQWAVHNKATGARKYALSKSSESARGWTTEPEPIFYLSSAKTGFPIHLYTATGGDFGYREYFQTSRFHGGLGWKKATGIFGYAEGITMAKEVPGKYKNAEIKIGERKFKNGDLVTIREVHTGWNWTYMENYSHGRPVILSSNNRVNRSYNQFILQIVGENKFRLKHRGSDHYAALICCTAEFGNGGYFKFLSLHLTNPTIFTSSFDIQSGSVLLKVGEQTLGRECCVPGRREVTSIPVAKADTVAGATGSPGKVSDKEAFLVIPWNEALNNKVDYLDSYSIRKKRDYTENWMRKGRAWLKDVPLNRIIFPGTHDSGMYYMEEHNDKAGELAADANGNIALQLANGLNASGNIKKWAKTQTLTVLEQLKSGVRYIDLRVCFDPDGFPYLCHSVYGHKLGVVISDIVEFAKDHPQELIIVDFQHIYTFSQKFPPKENDRLDKQLDRLKDQAVEANVNSETEYGDIIQPNVSRRNLIVLMKRYATLAGGILRPDWVHKRDEWICDGWTSINTKEKKIKNYEEEMQDCAAKKTLGYLPFAITPDSSHFLDGAIDTTSLRTFADETNPVMTYYLVKKWSKRLPIGHSGINIIATDFIERTCVVDLAIQMNNPKRLLAGIVPQSLDCAKENTGWD